MLQDEYNEAFCDAERCIKSVEEASYAKSIISRGIFLRGLLFPAVNELRYAAFHAIQASKKETEDERKEAWTEAIKHCHRAAYDGLESQFQYLINTCGNFQYDYRSILIADIVKDYQEDCQRLNYFKTVDHKRDGDHEKYWEKMQTYVSELEKICTKWETARPELNKKRQQERDKQWHRTLAVIGIIVGIAVGTFGVIHRVLSGVE
jgi:hypothetical protein